MLEGSLIIEGAAWRVRALRLMELDIDRFSTVLRTTRRARRSSAYFSSPVPLAPQTRVAPALIPSLASGMDLVRSGRRG